MTKRIRLKEVLAQKQDSDKCANNVLAFVTRVMNPVRFVGNRDVYETERGKLNIVLAFSGPTLGEDGKLSEISTVNTLTEAEAMANALRKALVERKEHADVLKFCRANLSSTTTMLMSHTTPLSSMELCIHIVSVDVRPPHSLHSCPFSCITFKKEFCFVH